MSAEPAGVLRGEKLRVEARKFTKPVLFVGSSRHREQRLSAYGNPALCIVEKEWRWTGSAGR